MFWLFVLLMLVLALAIVLPPLLRRPAGAVEQNAANVAVHRRRLQELEADQAAGVLSAEAAAEARAEIERQLLAELQPQRAVRTRPSRWAATAVAVLVPALALGLYARFGSDQPQELQAQVPADREEQVAFIREHIGELQAKVEAAPEDLEAWLMLARSHMVLQQYDQAAQTLARAQERFGKEPSLLADRAEAVGYAAGGDLAGLPSQLLAQALEQEPAHPKALWLSGLAAMQRDQAAEASQYWRRLLAVLPPESGSAQQVQQLLAQIGQAPAPQPPAEQARLQVRVRLDPALQSKLPADATVFVLARAAEGPRAPLAVVREPVSALPLEVELTDAMAMVPGMNLSRFPQVVVEARVSRSGQAPAESGDLFGRSQPIAAGTEEPVELVIDQVTP